MVDFLPKNNLLWQSAMNAARKLHPTLAQDTMNFRSAAVKWYCENGGKFNHDYTGPSDLSHTKALIANVFNTKHLISASLMAHGLQYQWREYLGTKSCRILVAKDEELVIARNGFFGINPIASGYQILTASNAERPKIIPSLVGYALLSLSRELSRRETKFNDFQR